MKTTRATWLKLLFLCATLGGAFPAHAYYDPGAQRWLNRDPVTEVGFMLIVRAGYTPVTSAYMADNELIGEEDGEMNLFTFILNSPMDFVDAYGLKERKWWPPSKWPWPKPRKDDPDTWPILYKKPWPSTYKINDKCSAHWYTEPFPDNNKPKQWIWIEYRF